jgi:hypothetical protein
MALRVIKPRQGNNPNDIKKKRTKAWAHENKDRCPVNAFRIYRSKRSDSMNKDDSSFFLAVNNVSNREYYHAWFEEMSIQYFELAL